MGCGQSKIENEEAINRCKERKAFMKSAVSSRNAFASAHSAYTISLKNIGAALSDFAEGEVITLLPSSTSPSAPPPPPITISSASASASSSSAAASASTSSAAAAVQPPVDAPLPPPPPPLPDFPPPPLQRAASMPDLPLPKKHSKPPVDDVIREEDGDADDEDEDDSDDDGRLRPRSRPAPEPVPVPSPQQAPLLPPDSSSGLGKPNTTPVWLSEYFFSTENIPQPSLSDPPEPAPAPPVISQEKAVAEHPSPPPPVSSAAAVVEPKAAVKKQKPAQQHTAAVGGGESKRGKMMPQSGPSVNLLQVLNQLDDHFLKAYESAHEVSKMLEATRMHYHSNFADNRGKIVFSFIFSSVLISMFYILYFRKLAFS